MCDDDTHDDDDECAVFFRLFFFRFASKNEHPLLYVVILQVVLDFDQTSTKSALIRPPVASLLSHLSPSLVAWVLADKRSGRIHHEDIDSGPERKDSNALARQATRRTAGSGGVRE